MAHSISAKKRVRQNAKRRARNRWRRDRYRTAIKTFEDTLSHGTVETAEQQLRGLYKLLDQVSCTGALHKNTASRYKGRLTVAFNKRKTTGAAAPAQA